MIELLDEEAVARLDGSGPRREGIRAVQEGQGFGVGRVLGIGFDEDGVIADGLGDRFGKDGMEFARTGEEEPAALHRQLGPVEEEGALAFHEIVEFVLRLSVGVVASVPRQAVAADEAVDIDRVLDPHATIMSILDMFRQYRVWRLRRSGPMLSINEKGVP